MTSRVEGDPYQELLHEKGGHGFPYLVFMKPDGEVLTRPARRTVESFASTRAACLKFLALEKKAATGDEDVAADLLIARMEMGVISFSAAKKAADELEEVPAAKRAMIFDLLTELEIIETMADVRTVAQAIEVGRRFAQMWGEGRMPKRPGRAAISFFHAIMEAAYADKDAKLYERALAEFKRVYPQGRSYARLVKQAEKRLAELVKQ